MSAAATHRHVPVDEYLAGELTSKVKHEYIGGTLYAMAGARNVHNLIATNALVALGSRFRGGPCRSYNSDTKIRVRLPTHVRFYYPDASVICRPNPQTESFQDQPAILVEVVSRTTRRTDEGEKCDAYILIPSLCVYLLIEQESALVVAYRRTEHGFVREVSSGNESIIPLPEVNAELPLAEIYEAVEWSPEPDDER